MNLLLFKPTDLRDGIGHVAGDRATHIREVLKKRVGEQLKVGVVGHGRGLGEILTDDASGITIRVGDLTRETPPSIHLIVALPRPLALSRLLHTAASFGVRHIDLIRAWKVPRSYFASPRLATDRIEADLLLGAEQGGQTWTPSLSIHEGFRRFVEDDLPGSPALAPGAGRFVLEPEAPHPFQGPLARSAAKSLAFGPEGGFLPNELESLEKAGFVPVRLGAAILTTEIAIASALAQLELLAATERATNQSMLSDRS